MSKDRIAMELASSLYKERLLKGAVPEAAQYPKALCNQACKRHLYFKDGKPYDQLTGKRHDCPMARIGKMWTGHLNLIPIERVRKTPLDQLTDTLDHQESFNRRWNQAWLKWKETGKIPNTEEVESY